MADQLKNQDVELDDDEIEEAHDPVNAEKQAIAATAAAHGSVKKAPARKGDKSNSEPMQKGPAGKTGVAHELMGKNESVQINTDFTDDLNALVESEATLSEEFKAKTAIIFEAAVKAKLSEEINRLEEEYATQLAEEVSTIKADLVEKVDSYLNYVVEQWMEDNKLAIQSGLRAEIAETFMAKLKDLFVESYVEVPESKVDLVDELATANEELEEKFNEAIAANIALTEEIEGYKRDAIIREASTGLAETQIAKLASLVENIDFEDEETFAAKVKTIKESYFKKKTAESTIVEETEEATTQEVSSPMAQYLAAIRRNSK